MTPASFRPAAWPPAPLAPLQGDEVDLWWLQHAHGESQMPRRGRVDRLLREPQPPARSASLRPWLLGAGAALIAAIYVPALPFVHRGLELLVR